MRMRIDACRAMRNGAPKGREMFFFLKIFFSIHFSPSFSSLFPREGREREREREREGEGEEERREKEKAREREEGGKARQSKG